MQLHNSMDPNLHKSTYQKPRKLKEKNSFGTGVGPLSGTLARLYPDRPHLGTAFPHGQPVSSLLDLDLPYLLGSMIRSGYCNRCGKIHQEVIVFNVSENLLLKAITVFLNRCAAGQAQMCCIPLNHSFLRT